MLATNPPLLEDLFQAYFDARRHKRNTINQLNFELNYELELIRLYDEIIHHCYHIRPSIAFIVKYPAMREIFAATFRDRVIHHLVYNYINPWWENRFINDSYSCRIGKGTLYGQKRCQHFMLSATDNCTREAYILKLDIRGYFINMNRHILFQKVKDGLKKQYLDQTHPNHYYYKLCLYLLHEIIFNDPTYQVSIKGPRSNWDDLPPEKSLFYTDQNRGFPIGNLTSQLFSNIYLNEFDQYIVYQLGCKRYGRYVDDFFIIDTDKDKLLKVKKLATIFLRDHLKLDIHPKKVYLQPCRHGVPFLGGVVYPLHIQPSSRLVGRFKNKAREFYQCPHPSERLAASYISYLGHLKHYRHYHLVEKTKEKWDKS